MVADFKKKSDVIPEIHGGVLKAAREKLKITPIDLAKKACLSKKHIIELEEGGVSAFFSPDHKIRVAKKVSLLLGLDENQAIYYPNGELAKQESLRFDVEATELDAQPVQTANNLKPKAIKEVKVQETEAIADVASRKTIKSSESIDSKKTVSLESLSQNYSSDQSAPKKSWKSTISILLILLIGGGLYVTKDDVAGLFNSKPVPVATAIEVVPENADGKSGDGPVVVPATQPVVPTPVTSTSSSPPLSSEAACPKSDATVAAVSVSEPNKSGNFVFIQSKIKQTICVSDASGKVTAQSLDAGASHTFTGKAPFTVLSSGLNNLNMFFQGRPVRYSNDQAKSIRLEEGKLVN